jgi:hypothetical protein
MMSALAPPAEFCSGTHAAGIHWRRRGKHVASLQLWLS